MVIATTLVCEEILEGDYMPGYDDHSQEQFKQKQYFIPNFLRVLKSLTTSRSHLNRCSQASFCGTLSKAWGYVFNIWKDTSNIVFVQKNNDTSEYDVRTPDPTAGMIEKPMSSPMILL